MVLYFAERDSTSPSAAAEAFKCLHHMGTNLLCEVPAGGVLNVSVDAALQFGTSGRSPVCCLGQRVNDAADADGKV